MQDEIRQAVTYAEFACDQAIYRSRAVGTANTAYNLAVADALAKPQVLDIDIHGWTGEAGADHPGQGHGQLSGAQRLPGDPGGRQHPGGRRN